jgi:hypothetical protein
MYCSVNLQGLCCCSSLPRMQQRRQAELAWACAVSIQKLVYNKLEIQKSHHIVSVPAHTLFGSSRGTATQGSAAASPTIR